MCHKAICASRVRLKAGEMKLKNYDKKTTEHNALFEWEPLKRDT